MMTDAELLVLFARKRSQDAFHTLLERHLKLVYGAALRQVRDPGTAEDVTQGVFLVLSKKASKLLGRPETLSAWLLTVTRYAVRDALRRRGTRMDHERKAADMKPQLSTSIDYENLGSIIDEALNRLNPPDRTAIALYYLENRSLREVGDVLAISEDAAQKRVSRALDRLKVILAGRGIACPADALETSLQRCGAVTIPAALLTTILNGVVGHAGASAAGAAIAHHVTRSLLMKKVAVFGLSTIAAAAVAAPVVPFVYHAAWGAPNITSPVQASPSANVPVTPAPIIAVPAIDVLDYVPADVDGVFVINNMNSFFDKLTTLTQKLNIPVPVPSATTFMTPTKYVDIHGPWIGVIPHLPQWLSGTAHEEYAIIHTLNPQKWISEFNPVFSQDGIWLIHGLHSDVAGPGGSITANGYAAIVGNNYVAIGFNRQSLVHLLASKQSLADTLSVNDLNMLEAGDMGYYINMANFREPLEKIVDANLTIAPQTLESMYQSKNKKFADQAEYGMATDKIFIHEILDDVKTSVTAYNISDDGISVDFDSQFEPGTPPADFVAQSEPVGEQPFLGLPRIDPVYARSINFSGGWMSGLFKKWSDDLAGNPDLQSNVQAQQTQQQWNLTAQFYQLLHTQATAVSVNPAVRPAIKGFTITTVDDPAGAMELQRQMVQNNINAWQNKSSSQITGFNLSGQLTQNALTAYNLSFDKWVLSVKPLPQAASNPASAMRTTMTGTVISLLENMLGPDGLTTYTGIQGNNIVCAMNVSNNELQSAVDAANNSTDALDSEPYIAAAKKHILPNASVIIYVRPSAVVQAIINTFTGRMSSGPAQSSSSAMVGSPISISMSGSQGRVFLPTSELEALSNEAHQLLPMFIMMSMMQQRAAPQQQPTAPVQPRQ